MAYETCADCGSKVYGGHCVNCHEEVFIAEQYSELGEPIPESIANEAARQASNPSMTEADYKNNY